MAEVGSTQGVSIPAACPPDLCLGDTQKLGMAGSLLPLAVGLLLFVDPDGLEHPSFPIGLGVVAERPFRYLDAAEQDVKVVVVLGLPKGREFLSAISAPAEKEVEGHGGKRAEDHVGIPHTTHVFDLPVRVLLPLPHDRNHTRRRLVRFRALVLQVDEHKVGKLKPPPILTPSNGAMACVAVSK